MNCQQANAVCIVDFLASAGFSPEKSTSVHAWYRSPLRDESTPSFKVDTSRNIWFDHGSGSGGRLVDLVQAMHKVELPDALRIIAGADPVPSSSHQHRAAADPVSAGITVLRVEPLQHPALISYCASRSIPAEVAQAHLRECHFLTSSSSTRQFALAFPNRTGGYELRNKLFKGCTNKDFSLIQSGDATAISVFEGFFDYLSALVLSKRTEPSRHVLVLNSLSMLPAAIAELSRYETIRLYLDADDPGQRAAEAIRAVYPAAVNKSGIYGQHKDLNEYISQATGSR
jgi:hypothetical protein